MRIINQPVFYRISPAKPQMRCVVFGCVDVVFPKPPLPDTAFLAGQVTKAQMPFWQTRREPCFDQPPAG